MISIITGVHLVQNCQLRLVRFIEFVPKPNKFSIQNCSLSDLFTVKTVCLWNQHCQQDCYQGHKRQYYSGGIVFEVKFGKPTDAGSKNDNQMDRMASCAIPRENAPSQNLSERTASLS